jgi:nucleoside-diphosphate-sugar epimerase
MGAPILVTGATGFVGGALLRRLRSEGQPVIGLGRDPTRCAALRAEGFDIREHDLAGGFGSQDMLAFGEVSAIVHSAARAAPHGRLESFVTANVTATHNVLDLARALSVRRLVFLSSSSVCFAPRDQLLVKEGDPLPVPFNAYARTKAIAEGLVLAAKECGPVVLRPRGIYGIGDTALLPRLLRAARRGPLPLVRNGQAQIDLTHIDDVVDATLVAVRSGPDVAGQVFNISGGEVLPITEIAGLACARAETPLRWRRMPLAPLMLAAGLVERACRLIPGEPEPAITRYGLALFAFAQSLDLTKARDLLGWRPKVPFAEGLARTFPEGAPR